MKSICLSLLAVVVSHAQTLESLHEWPQPGLVGDPQGALVVDGNDLVGVTGNGGTSNGGFAFKLNNGTLTKFFDFNQNGWVPRGGLIKGSDGNYYGTTFAGGLGSQAGFPGSGSGTVFRLTPSGTFTVLLNFGGSNSNPFGELVEVTPLVFAGVAQQINSTFGGAVFQLDASGGSPSYTLLKQLNAFTDGRVSAGLIKASDGRLYGSTERVIFGMDADGGNFAELRRVSSSTDTTGYGFSTGVTEGSDGLLYGLTSQGGDNGKGVVFRIGKDGSSYTVLHHFDGTTGGGVTANIVRARIVAHSDGSLYAAPAGGGEPDSGTLIKITTSGTVTKLTNFAVSRPSGLVEKSGTLLITTNTYNDRGVLYSSDTAGTLTSLYAFNDVLGTKPVGAPLQASDGHLYGTTAEGGVNGLGTLWRRKSTGEFEVLASFGGSLQRPDSGLIEGSDGLFYGTTIGNYTSQTGYVYSATKAGKITSVANVSNDGGILGGLNGVAEGPDNHLYAVVNAGRLVKIQKNGTTSILRTFANSDGTGGYGPPVIDANGDIYGVTRSGGANGVGTVWKYSGSTFSVLRPFQLQEVSGTNTGSPKGPLTLGRDGALYGLLFQGASRQYRITTAGVLTLQSSAGAVATDGEPTAHALVERSLAKFFIPHFLPASATDTSRTVYQYAAGGASSAVLLPASPVTIATLPAPAYPRVGGISRGADAYLYGVLPDGAANSGSLYRVTFPPSSDPLPGATTLAASSVQSVKATLNGEVTPNGTPAVVWFEYGATSSYGKKTPAVLIQPGGTATVPVSATVTGLVRGAEFHFRLVAENDGGRTNGSDVSATTATNSAPTAVNDVVPVRAKEVVTTAVLANDSDQDGDPFSIQAFTQGAKGTVVQEGNSLKYTPGKLFKGFDTFTYTIADSNNATSTATVTVRNPFLFIAGTYTALLGAGNGSLTLTVTKTGTGIAKVIFPNGKKYTLKGSVGLNGAFNSTLERKGTTPLVVTLNITEPDVPRVTGTVDGEASEDYAVSNIPVTATSLPAGIEGGAYTTIFAPPGGAPAQLQANGWATTIISKTAGITFKGQLPDGATLTLGGKLRADGTCTIYSSGKAPDRSLRADFNFTPTATAHFTGQLLWNRAAVTKGFYLPAISMNLGMSGARFIPPPKNVRSLTYTTPNAPLASGLISLENGNLLTMISRTVNVSTADKVTITVSNPEAVKFTLNRGIGLISGTFKHSGFTPAKVVKFKGVMRQTPTGGSGLNAGFGLFLGASTAGNVTFQPQ